MEEIEVKFLNIDIAVMEEKLRSIGAERIFERLYKRRVFDYPDLRLDKAGAWIRLRDEGDRVTLSFKQRQGMGQDHHVNDATMKEIELVVDDFARAAEFLIAIGFKEKFYEENRRIRYLLGNIEFDLDSWPGLAPYLEIEAPSWEEIDRAINLLGLDPQDKRIFSTHQVYALSGIDEHAYQEITFERMVKRALI